ncbi:hypothetical protein BDV96DRAFT_110799 [Lophiotrema nucula]|uniref:Uncharacterized protein n=1 Tax=Lophiotrema nucula TaxID=690887 RepID=A0A6A5Z458_9PLEO|nr:hypothetical protein BDV96DRAFT_110799 [Lophiotrema nucula]
MLAVEDDRQTSVSDPAPQTSTIDEASLGNSHPRQAFTIQRVPPFPQHVGTPTRTPFVHFRDETGISPKISKVELEDSKRTIDHVVEEASPKKASDNAAQLRAIDIWLAARPRIAAIRIQILTFRVDVKRERDGYSRVESLIEKVLDQFMEILGTAGTTGAYMSSWDHLEHLRDRLLSAREDLKKQREKLAAVEDGLSNQEYKLTEMEQEIYQELDREYLSGPSSQTHTGLALNTPPPTTSDTNTTHSAQQELYSRMGDLRILLDRLNDFEVDLRQELDDRDVSRAYGETGLIPDEQFFEEHRNVRKQLQQDMDGVQAEISRLKQLCDSQMIPYEDVQFPEPLYEASTSDASTTSARLPEAPVPEPAVSQRSGSSSVIKSFMNTRDRVKKWLGDPLNPAEVRRPIAEENEVEPLSSPSGLDNMPPTKITRPSPATIHDIRDALQKIPPWVDETPSDLLVSISNPLEGRRVHRRASDTAL